MCYSTLSGLPKRKLHQFYSVSIHSFRIQTQPNPNFPSRKFPNYLLLTQRCNISNYFSNFHIEFSVTTVHLHYANVPTRKSPGTPLRRNTFFSKMCNLIRELFLNFHPCVSRHKFSLLGTLPLSHFTIFFPFEIPNSSKHFTLFFSSRAGFSRFTFSSFIHLQNKIC